jgi:hypothetical protein
MKSTKNRDFERGTHVRKIDRLAAEAEKTFEIATTLLPKLAHLTIGRSLTTSSGAGRRANSVPAVCEVSG